MAQAAIPGSWPKTSTMLFVILAAFSLVASSCGFGAGPDPDSQTTPALQNPQQESETTEAGPLAFDEIVSSTSALEIGLSNAVEPSANEPLPEVDVVEGQPLSAAEAQAIFDRVGLPSSNSTEAPAEVVDVNRPADTLLPPTVENRVDGTFPPDAGSPAIPDAPADGPLEILRVQPEGLVDLAPFISVTFNEPMIPLSTLNQIDDLDVPVEITPDREALAELGFQTRWRWIGARTARLEVVPLGAIDDVGQGSNSALDRLPGSTEFTLTVPAGTESVNGAVLEEDFSFSFTTSSPEPVQTIGFGDRMGLNPVIAVVFDQRIDPSVAIESISFESGDVNGVRLATDEEVAAAVDDQISGIYWPSAPADRVVMITPDAQLDADTPVRLQVGPGVRSLEGPLVGSESVVETGRTFPPLRIEEDGCDSGCVPLQPLRTEFTNPIDPELFDPDWVTISPELDGAQVQVSWDSIVVVGATRGNTDYDVFFSADLTDIYGQTLGEQVRADFDIGDAPPAFAGPNDVFVVVDPFAESPGILYQTVNHDDLRVRAWDVTPEQYEEFRAFQSNLDPGEWTDPSWPLVVDTEVFVDSVDDTVVQTEVDLSEAFDRADGPIAVIVEPARILDSDNPYYWSNRPIATWVQDTTIAVDVFADGSDLVVWATDLTTGQPIADASVRLIGERTDSFSTDEDGLTVVPLNNREITSVVVEANGDLAHSPKNNWAESTDSARGLWFVTDDRSLYRPGETVRVAGLYRDQSVELQPVLDTNEVITYRAHDSRGVDLGSGRLTLNSFGGFNLAIDVPAGANAGSAQVEFDGPNGSHYHSFQVQDFRTPDFEATVDAVTPAPYLVGEPATFSADASYFAGGPLANSLVEWSVITQNGFYAPPNWDEFSFGEWSPPWFGWYSDDFGGFNDLVDVTTFVGTTDLNGQHLLQADFASPDGSVIDQPSTVRFEATVSDVNRQSITAQTSVLVHPAALTLGLRSDESFVEPGEPIVVDAVVVDLEGELAAGRTVEVTAGRQTRNFVNGEVVSELSDVQSCTISSTGDQANSRNSVDRDEAMRCSFDADTPGRWMVSAVVEDAAGRQSRATLSVWVSGGTATSVDGLSADSVTIIPNQESYAPGDTAELLVQGPFAPASGLMIIDRGGIETVSSFDALDGSAVLNVPITSVDSPNTNVRIDMVGATDRRTSAGIVLEDEPPQPAYATGSLRLDIPPAHRALEVLAVPATSETAPGASTSVTVEVRDSNGQPVEGAGVSLIVVDEAVLSLTGYELGDPLDAFYPNVDHTVWAQLMRDAVLLTPPEITIPENVDSNFDEITESIDEVAAVAESASDDAGGEPAAERSAAGAPDENAIDLRDNFDSLAVFTPDEETDGSGAVTVSFDLPDSLTRYRVMAIANAGADQFGTGESQITAQLPVNVRLTAPAFLNLGDEFELPIIVQNLESTATVVDLAFAGDNLELTDDSGKQVSVPANSRIEVRLPLRTQAVGTATVHVAASSGDFVDAIVASIPVYTPATAEAFATYGVLDGGEAIAQGLLAPADVLTQVGGLDISTSTTAVSALADAVLYLNDYPYQTPEGYSSRIMAIAALRDVLAAFDAPGLPAPGVLDAKVQADVEALVALQDDWGTWSWWRRNGEVSPWVTVQATHALIIADQSGFDVDQESLQRALEVSQNIQDYIDGDAANTYWTVRAYGLYVAGLAGQDVAGLADELYREAGDQLGLDAAAHLLTVLHDGETRSAIMRQIENGAVETPSAATFATSYGDNGYLIAYSDRRTDGIVLDALIREEPSSDLIVKAVNGLIANQTNGRWNNAQENAFILLALNEYFTTFENVSPDVVTRAWLGETYVSEAEFVGRTTDTVTTRVPMQELIDAGDTDLVLSAEGDGRVYYRLGLEYAPSDFDLEPRDEGFVVERSYEAIDDPDDVRQLEDGTWEIVAGASVRVNLEMVADARRTQVGLIDPLAAGLEPVNPALATSQSTFGNERAGGSYWYSWFNHQNLRSDRVEAFATRLWAGTYTYSYIAEATIPGSFVVPPAVAEEIFNPEVFGRSGSDRVVIIDPAA